jgi:hypothetical protein
MSTAVSGAPGGGHKSSSAGGGGSSGGAMKSSSGGSGGNSKSIEVHKVKKTSSKREAGSRSYPRGVGLDFRKLGGLTLVSYIDHHGTFTGWTFMWVFVFVSCLCTRDCASCFWKRFC